MVTGKIGLKSVFRYVLLTAVLMVMIFPLLWMFRVSLMPTGHELSDLGMQFSTLTLENYRDLFSSSYISWPLFNSAVVGLAVMLGNLIFSFMAGYTLARYRTLSNRILMVSVLVVLMIPVHITIIPMYLLMVKLHLYDSYWALILPFMVNPIGIFLVKQYVESIPPSLEEAARIDGAGELRIVFRVVMPICRPVLAVLAIQVFFTNWNSFLFPFILTSSENLRTLPVALAMLQGHQAIDWQHLMAGSAIAVIPVLVIFIILQRQIVSGITAGAIKQ